MFPKFAVGVQGPCKRSLTYLRCTLGPLMFGSSHMLPAPKSALIMCSEAQGRSELKPGRGLLYTQLPPFHVLYLDPLM